VTDKQEAAGGGYRISELVEASGASRDMIKYYLRANLLPTPDKPRPNLSLYSDNHLELIALIQRFQAQTKLSLEEIAEVFGAAQYNANSIKIELLSARHSVDSDDNIIPLRPSAEKSRNLTFPEEFLHELVNASLLPCSGSLDNDQEQLASLLWAARDAGVPLTFFQQAREKLVELADLEVKTLVAIKRPEQNFNSMVENVIDADRIINRWMITEKNGQIRNQFQRVIDNSERAVSTLMDTFYQPSELFRERYGIEATVSRLCAELEVTKAYLQPTHELCMACLLLAEYERTIVIAEHSLTLAPQDAIATASLAIAHGMLNNVDKAYEYGSELEGCAVNHPLILQARIFALLLQAGKMHGVTDTSELMKSAGELFLEMPREKIVEEPVMILFLARANVAFPDFSNSRPQAIASLQALLQQLDSNTIKLPGLSLEGLEKSLKVIFRIYALYFLGVLLEAENNHADARACLEQAIQLDPASNFGQWAYLRLGQST